MITNNISIIGAGNMSSAILEGIFRKKLFNPNSTMVTNRSFGKLEKLQKKWQIKINYDNSKAAGFADFIILAVKPIDIKIACKQLKKNLSSDKLIISVAAGISIQKIKEWLGHAYQPVIRVMPNTPAQIGLGMSGWSASEEVSLYQRNVTKQLLQTLGSEIFFEEEDNIDKVTAISGSGPAYVFHLAEIMAESGISIGLKEKDARELVLQTIYGAATMMRANGKTPAELKTAVTSKGGTTEAALKEFEKGKFSSVVKSGIQAAHIRGREIGSQ